jgi:putative redox protein
MEATMTLQQRMSFVGKADSGFTVNLGADPDVGGDADGFRPMELMLLSLIGCTAMDVISILRKKRQHVTAFDVQAHAEQADEHPKVFTAVTLKYVVHGVGIDPQAVARAIELSQTKYCPAQAMLVQAVPIVHEYEIIEVEKGNAI